MTFLTSRRRLQVFAFSLGILLVSAQPAGAQTLPQISPLVVNSPDLTIALSASPSPVMGGGLVTLTANVTNVPVVSRSPTASATNVSVWLSVPTGVTVITQPWPTASSSNFTCTLDPSWIKCAGGTVAAGSTVTITAYAVALAPKSGSFQGGTLFWTAAVDPANTVGERDDNNNYAMASARVMAPLPDLEIKSFAAAVAPPQQSTTTPLINYTAEITNVGESAANNAVVQILTPTSGMSIGAGGAATGGFICSSTTVLQGALVTCTGGSIAPGGSVTVTATTMWNGQSYLGTAKVIADPNGTLLESDESNNEMSILVGF